MTKLKIPKKWTLIIAASIVILAALAPSYYFYNEYQKSQSLLKNPTQAATAEVKAIKDKVARHMELPTGEEPTLATVSDKEKLRDQAFFAKAENGDKVLIYTQARKAILYRPSIDKIIEVSTVNLGEGESETASPPQTQEAKIAIYNGTAKVGLTKAAQDKLAQDKVNVEVLDRDNAKNQDYKETLVIDLSGKNKILADSIIKSLGGKSSSLPPDEKSPEGVDILIILGSDYNI